MSEVGGGLGEGYTVNVPLPGGTGDMAMLKAFRDILVPAAVAFRPDLGRVSAGGGGGGGGGGVWWAGEAGHSFAGAPCVVD